MQRLVDTFSVRYLLFRVDNVLSSYWLQIPKNIKPAELKASESGLEVKCKRVVDGREDIAKYCSREGWPCQLLRVEVVALAFLQSTPGEIPFTSVSRSVWL